MTSREGQLVTDQSHNPPEISSGEAQLTALMALDAAVQRARASGEDDDEPRKADRRRRPPSAETRAKLSAAARLCKRPPKSEEVRAKIAEKMRGNSNAKRNHDRSSPTISRRAGRSRRDREALSVFVKVETKKRRSEVRHFKAMSPRRIKKDTPP